MIVGVILRLPFLFCRIDVSLIKNFTIFGKVELTLNLNQPPAKVGV
jgi:hypothetical protein